MRHTTSALLGRFTYLAASGALGIALLASPSAALAGQSAVKDSLIAKQCAGNCNMSCMNDPAHQKAEPLREHAKARSSAAGKTQDAKDHRANPLLGQRAQTDNATRLRMEIYTGNDYSN
jgi:hypothetical protein